MRIFIIILVCFLGQFNANALKLGVTAGPHAVIAEEVKKNAKEEGLDIEIIEFNDFILPNAALDAGEIDVNSYQHQPFLDEQVKTRHYKIVSLAKNIVLPLGVYSNKHKSLDEVNSGDIIAIPNDPTNGGRALFLLEKAGLITLKDTNTPTILDIVDNHKNLKIIEIEAPQIPRTLNDVDYGITNTDWILVAGIDPSTALIREDKDSPYTNIIAVREENRDKEEIKKFIKLYQSAKIKNFINEQFKGAVIAAW